MSSAAQISDLEELHKALPTRNTRGVYVGFASMVTIGLALAGWYVGERILAAQAAAIPTPAQPAITAALQPFVAPEPAAPDPDLSPSLPEYYLQVPALGTPHDAKFLKQLQARGFPAQLETAAADQPAIIQIGPFPDERTLRRARSKLAASGILAEELIR